MLARVFRLCVAEASSVASGVVNDDVVGHIGNAAWVIDGATDIGEGPLVGEASDAAWLAGALGDWLASRARDLPANLKEIVPSFADHAAQQFARLSRRAPTGRFEHPSAAGLVAHIEGPDLVYLALGDCSLLVQWPNGGVFRYGVPDEEAGDAWLAQHLSASANSADPEASASQLRAGLMPVLRQARERMNLSPGYGVFSITATPSEYVLSGRVPLEDGTRILLASDGFMRLVDVFGTFNVDELMGMTVDLGVAAMLDILRRTERSDDACRRYPRAKCSDDASALLATVSVKPE